MRTKRTISPLSWATLAAFLVLPLILYGAVVLGDRAIFWGTPLLQFWPWRRFAAESLRAGRLPLWNPYAGNGVPLLADHQSAILYPPNLIFWLFPVERAMGFSMALHAMLAAATMYALARELGLSRLGGLVAALAFAFSGYMVSRGSFLTEISALPWLPLLWLCARRLMRQPGLRAAGRLAAVIALQFLAGHAQTWFYSMCSLGLYALWEGIRASATRDMGDASPRQGRSPRTGIRPALKATLTRYLLLALAVLWGVALAAAQFLPTLELSQVAGRAGRDDWESFALQYSFWPWRALTLLLPDFFGNPARGNYWGYATYWEDAGHVGVLPFLFALLAVVTWLHRRSHAAEGSPLRHVPFFASLSVLALLMALGKNTPFYMLFFRYVPGFGSFQAPARWLCVYTPAVALLAGIGVDALRPSTRLTFVCRLGVAAGAAIAVTVIVAQQFLSDVQVTFFSPLIWFAVWFTLSMLLFLWGQNVRPAGSPRGDAPRRGPFDWGMLYPPGVALVVAADLILAGRALNPTVDVALYAPETGIGAFLQADGPQGRTFYLADGREEVMFGQYLDFGDYGPSDLAYWRGMRESLLPDLGMVEHLPSANSFEPLVEGRYHALVQAIEQLPDGQAMRLLGIMNVAYILDPSPERAQEIAYRSPSVTVYRNPDPLPRAYVVCRARAARTPTQALEMLTGTDWNPWQEVILESPSTVQGASCQAQQTTLLPSSPNRVTIRAVLSQPGYLVLTDTYYPGWQALVDGRRTEILRANYAFRAVELSAGEHEVVFRYRPTSFWLGAACSAAALACVAAALAHKPRPGARGRRPGDHSRRNTSRNGKPNREHKSR